MTTRRPIPIPAKLKWREFRQRALPSITLGTTLLAVIGLWTSQIKEPALVGRALAPEASVISPITGEITALNVGTYQRVTKGEALATIQPIGVKNQLSSLRLEIDLIRNRIEPLTERKRNAVSYYRLRLEWLQQRVALAASKVNLQRARNELARDENLFNAQLISADQFDQTQKSVEALVAEVAEATNLVKELGAALDGLEELDSLNQSEQLNAQLQLAIESQEEHLRRLEAFSGPHTLIAPISGKVTDISYVEGETVLDGARVLSITAEEPTQLIAYVKDSTTTEIEPGTPVRLQTRGTQRRTAEALVEGVSPKWQRLGGGTNEDLNREFGIEFGLPILLTLPPELGVRPGELVDVFLPES